MLLWYDTSHIPYLRSEGKGDPRCEWCRVRRWGWNVPLVDTQADTRRRWTGPRWSPHPPPLRSGKAQDRGTPVAHRLRDRERGGIISCPFKSVMTLPLRLYLFYVTEYFKQKWTTFWLKYLSLWRQNWLHNVTTIRKNDTIPNSSAMNFAFTM